VGFPAVIKPEFGCSAIGCYRVDSVRDLEDAYHDILPVLPSLEPIFAEYGTDLLLEQYLDGTEFDIDILLWEGECRYAGVSENWPTNEPYFFETGLHAPSAFPPDQLAEVVDLSVNATRSLGLDRGAFHVEAKFTSEGPRIIEVNARMGGTIVRDANLMLHGVDFVEEHLMASTGIPINPLASEEAMGGISNILLYAERTGRIGPLDWVGPIASDPRVFFAEANVHEGDQVVAAADGFPTELLEVALREVDAPTAVASIRELTEGLSITYR